MWFVPKLTGLPDVPTCLASHCDPDDEEAPSLLIVGDDGGDVFIVRFLRPTASLFKKIVIDRKQVMVWQVSAVTAWLSSVLRSGEED